MHPYGIDHQRSSASRIFPAMAEGESGVEWVSSIPELPEVVVTSAPPTHTRQTLTHLRSLSGFSL